MNRQVANLLYQHRFNLIKANTVIITCLCIGTKTACTLLPYSILNLIKVDITYLRTVILTASTVGACWLGLAIAIRGYATGVRDALSASYRCCMLLPAAIVTALS